MKRVAVVVQRWGPDIVGGSESHAWQYAKLLSEKYRTELLTSTALSSETWANAMEPGLEEIDGIQVRRFATVGRRDTYWHRLSKIIFKNFSSRGDDRHSFFRAPALQEEWIRSQGPWLPDLHRYLELHANEYDAFIFLTYLYAPTYYGTLSVGPEKSLLVPTLHDEPPAYFPVFAEMARRTAGILWNTRAERRLGEKLWGSLPGSLVSMYINVGEKKTGKNSEKVGIAASSDDPYILYCGRIDPGKGCAELFTYFRRYCRHYARKHSAGLRLIISGTAQMKLPRDRSIEYRGFVSPEEKSRLMEGAACFCLASPNESLSIVLLEAMACRTPVMVYSGNPVLADHIADGRGVGYRSYAEFAAGLDRILSGGAAIKSMGIAAQNYVMQNYSKEVVRERLYAAVDGVIGGS